MPWTVIAPIIASVAIGGASIAAGALEASASRRQMAAGQAQQELAMQAQERASRAAEEDAQLQASGQDASTRIARAAGLHILGFQGDTSAGGLATTLGQSPKGQSTLGTPVGGTTPSLGG